MENYEQKYKEALNWMCSIYPTMQGTDREDAEHHFPELKESEDEKIRKFLIKCVQQPMGSNFLDGIKKDDVIAWLEKRGNQKSIDKVKPKFKKNDWITNGACTIKITSVDDRYYWHDNDCVGGNIESIDKEYHLWTIQDAKDGDVLVANMRPFIYSGYLEEGKWPFGYGGINLYGRFGKSGGLLPMTHDEVIPATKEQRDLLFQKMKEAGYEWDAEKKELKKIEQKPIEDVNLPEFESYLCLMLQKFRIKGMCTNGEIIDYVEEHSQKLRDILVRSAWSEEDEKMRKLLINILNVNHPNGFFKVNEIDDANMQGIHKDTIVDWLKSLKPNHWKPSEFQLECLRRVIPHHDTEIDNELEYVLTELYDNLKKL